MRKHITAKELVGRVTYYAWNVSNNPLETLESAIITPEEWIDEGEDITSAQLLIASKRLGRILANEKKRQAKEKQHIGPWFWPFLKE